VITRLLTWLRSSASYLWLIGIAVYLAISAGQAVLRNYQSQQETKRLNAELETRKEEKERLEALVVYYNTDVYREKELRRALLLKKPGERVYALPESAVALELEQQVKKATDSIDPRRALPSWRQWVDYVLHGNEQG
jgi:cell division protein FtsB